MKTKGLQKHDEASRIAALRRYNILDTPPDGSFDRLTRLAAELFDVPIAIVSLVDEDRIWFKSKYGLDVDQINREPGLCASAILTDDIYLVEDARKDPRTLANPLVAGEFGLKFYAAAPLKTKEDGFNLGTFCLLDKKERTLSQKQQEVLKILADVVMDEIELRLSALKSYRLQKEMLGIFAHDLKSPARRISILSDFLIQDKNDPAAVEELTSEIKNASVNMSSVIESFLESSRLEANMIRLNFSKVNLTELCESVLKANRALAIAKDQQLVFENPEEVSVFGDQQRLAEIADNLISNAIKFSERGKQINIRLSKNNGQAILSVQDQGPGLTDEDMKKLFHRFSRLSAQPTAGESSTGLGLSIVKHLVELHKGKVWAQSDGSYSTFFVELPLA